MFFHVYLAFSMFLVIFQCLFSVFNVFVIMAGGKNAEGEWAENFFPDHPLEMISSPGENLVEFLTPLLSIFSGC